MPKHNLILYLLGLFIPSVLLLVAVTSAASANTRTRAASAASRALSDLPSFLPLAAAAVTPSPTSSASSSWFSASESRGKKKKTRGDTLSSLSGFNPSLLHDDEWVENNRQHPLHGKSRGENSISHHKHLVLHQTQHFFHHFHSLCHQHTTKALQPLVFLVREQGSKAKHAVQHVHAVLLQGLKLVQEKCQFFVRLCDEGWKGARQQAMHWMDRLVMKSSDRKKTVGDDQEMTDATTEGTVVKTYKFSKDVGLFLSDSSKKFVRGLGSTAHAFSRRVTHVYTLGLGGLCHHHNLLVRSLNRLMEGLTSKVSHWTRMELRKVACSVATSALESMAEADPRVKLVEEVVETIVHFQEKTEGSSTRQGRSWFQRISGSTTTTTTFEDSSTAKKGGDDINSAAASSALNHTMEKKMMITATTKSEEGQQQQQQEVATTTSSSSATVTTIDSSSASCSISTSTCTATPSLCEGKEGGGKGGLMAFLTSSLIVLIRSLAYLVCLLLVLSLIASALALVLVMKDDLMVHPALEPYTAHVKAYLIHEWDLKTKVDDSIELGKLHYEGMMTYLATSTWPQRMDDTKDKVVALGEQCRWVGHQLWTNLSTAYRQKFPSSSSSTPSTSRSTAASSTAATGMFVRLWGNRLKPYYQTTSIYLSKQCSALKESRVATTYLPAFQGYLPTKEGLQKLWEVLSTFFVNVKTKLSTHLTGLWSKLSTNFVSLKTKLSTYITALWRKLSAFGVSLKTNLSTYSPVLWRNLSTFSAALKTKLSTFFVNLKTKLSTYLALGVSKGKEGWILLKEVCGKVGTWLKEKGGLVVTSLKQTWVEGKGKLAEWRRKAEEQAKRKKDAAASRRSLEVDTTPSPTTITTSSKKGGHFHASPSVFGTSAFFFFPSPDDPSAPPIVASTSPLPVKKEKSSGDTDVIKGSSRGVAGEGGAAIGADRTKPSSVEAVAGQSGEEIASRPISPDGTSGFEVLSKESQNNRSLEEDRKEVGSGQKAPEASPAKIPEVDSSSSADEEEEEDMVAVAVGHALKLQGEDGDDGWGADSFVVVDENVPK